MNITIKFKDISDSELAHAVQALDLNRRKINRGNILKQVRQLLLFHGEGLREKDFIVHRGVISEADAYIEVYRYFKESELQ